MEEELEIVLESEETFDIELETDVVEVVTSDYEKLNNLPKINDIELKGNKTAKDLKLQEEVETLTNLEIEQILKI